LVACLSFIPALCSAEQRYQITETELERLDRNLTELRNINDRQRTESATLRKQLAASQTQLTEAGKQSQILKAQLGALKLTLEGQEQSLQNANRLLRQYEQEERSRLRKIKGQRNIAYVIAAACLYFAVRKL
jgi:septal ring factor EnvC (AmiA/AmiB activator)